MTKHARSFMNIATVALFLAFLAAALATGNTMASAAAENEKVEVEKLASWALAEEDRAEITLGKEKYEFFPQSFATDGKSVFFINRHAPFIAKMEIGKKEIESVTPLRQDTDKKFSARFFTDVDVAKDGFFCFEQSTGTLRKADEKGAIKDYYLVTERDGSITEKFFRLSETKFAVVDCGLKSIYVRDIADKNINVNPDSAGVSLVCEAESVACGPAGIVTVEKLKDGGFEALASQPESEDSAVVAKWPKEVKKAVALDCDPEGNIYFYVEDEKGASIQVASKKDGKYAAAAFACGKIEFPEKATRSCRALAKGVLLITAMDQKSVYLGKIALPLR